MLDDWGAFWTPMGLGPSSERLDLQGVAAAPYPAMYCPPFSDRVEPMT